MTSVPRERILSMASQARWARPLNSRTILSAITGMRISLSLFSKMLGAAARGNFNGNHQCFQSRIGNALHQRCNALGGRRQLGLKPGVGRSLDYLFDAHQR
jgi:hypothetical protein